jgi:NAD+ synthase
MILPEMDYVKVVEHITKKLRWYVTDYAHKETGVLGLSGGIDSTVTTYLATMALGKDKVLVFLLPSRVTPKEDMEDAMDVIERLEIPATNWKIVSIDSIVEAFEKTLERVGNLERGNIMARVRMTILHHEAALHNGLVIGTGDRSELLMGYFTKYGDAGVDVLPIAGLYKTYVKQLAKHLKVPERIIQKPPSPRLWPGQTAEEELGIDYETLDAILYLKFDKGFDEEEITRHYAIPRELVKKVLSRVETTRHKRQFPEVL